MLQGFWLLTLFLLPLSAMAQTPTHVIMIEMKPDAKGVATIVP